MASSSWPRRIGTKPRLEVYDTWLRGKPLVDARESAAGGCLGEMALPAGQPDRNLVRREVGWSPKSSQKGSSPPGRGEPPARLPDRRYSGRAVTAPGVPTASRAASSDSSSGSPDHQRRPARLRKAHSLPTAPGPIGELQIFGRQVRMPHQAAKFRRLAVDRASWAARTCTVSCTCG